MFLNSAVVAIVLWGRTGPVRLVAWVAALWLVAAGRLALGVAYARSTRAPDEAERWGRLLTMGAAVNGVVWGAAPFLLGAGVSLAHLIFLAFVLGGMAAGGALSNATHQPAFLAFTVPALLPMTALLLAGGDRLQVGMGIMLAVFGVAVTAISRTGGRALGEAVRLRFRNADLVNRLSAFAGELEARVKERSAELEAALSREREAEQRLARAARLAALGSIAAGVAHEINNPLTYVGSNLRFVADELARGAVDAEGRAAMLDALRDAGDGAERVRVIVRQLTDLARVDRRGAAEWVDLRTALDECAGMVANEVRPRATLLREYQAAPAVMGERSQVIQVFLNLLLNAAHAIPEGNPAANSIRIAARADPASGQVMVEVSDTGCGIPAASLERIWEPFFTTKPIAQGTGLGLSLCKNIVAGLGGRIAVESRDSGGSTFTVWLRAAPPVNAPPSAT
ncbi:MAG TPA: ATP-binding protein [Anaeromyxobacteraceae bacterium]